MLRSSIRLRRLPINHYARLWGLIRCTAALSGVPCGFRVFTPSTVVCSRRGTLSSARVLGLTHDFLVKNTTPPPGGGKKTKNKYPYLSGWRILSGLAVLQALRSLVEPPRRNCRQASRANLILFFQTSLGRNRALHTCPHFPLSSIHVRLLPLGDTANGFAAIQRLAQVNSSTLEKTSEWEFSALPRVL